VHEKKTFITGLRRAKELLWPDEVNSSFRVVKSLSAGYGMQTASSEAAQKKVDATNFL
jgi:hypothetical protein